MTNQQLFNRVSQHLLRQNQQALLSENLSAYRSLTGLRCPIGYLMKSRYRPEFEGFRVVSLTGSKVSIQVARAIQRAAGLRSDDYQLRLAEELQILHDECRPATWATNLESIRLRWHLKPATARRQSRKKGH